MINVQDCLKDFRCKIGVSDEAPINLKECFLKLNILVLFKDMTDNVKGLSVKDSETGLSAILINSKLSVGKQHETIAHELFHVLYDDTLGSESSEMESEANEFASYLLLPKCGLEQYKAELSVKDENVVLQTILIIENRYRISRELLLRRIADDHLCDETIIKKIQSIDIEASAESKGYSRKLYQANNRDLLISDYENLAKNLLDDNKISEGHYTELINLIGNGKD